MENKTTKTNTIADNLKMIEFCVKKLDDLSDGYKPLPRRMVGYGIMNDPLDMSDSYWDPFNKENAIDNRIAHFKGAVASLIEQKDNLTQTQFYAIQNRTLDIAKHAIKTQRLADATQFIHLIASAELEGKTSPMKNRSAKVKELLLDTADAYKAQYDSLSGGIFSKQSSSDANKQYRIKKTVEELMDDIDAGKYGEELKGQAKGSVYKEIESKFFSFGRYFVHDHDMF